MPKQTPISSIKVPNFSDISNFSISIKYYRGKWQSSHISLYFSYSPNFLHRTKTAFITKEKDVGFLSLFKKYYGKERFRIVAHKWKNWSCVWEHNSCQSFWRQKNTVRTFRTWNDFSKDEETTEPWKIHDTGKKEIYSNSNKGLTSSNKLK